MSIDAVTLYLRKARMELDKSAVLKLSQDGSNSPDYDAVRNLLAFSSRIERLEKEFRIMVGRQMDEEERPRSQSASGFFSRDEALFDVQGISKDESFPKYFISGGRLHKIGLASSVNGRRYRKSVPLTDVRMVCSNALEAAVGRVFHIKDLEAKLDELSSYKVSITVMALVQAGVLGDAGRGKYRIMTPPGATPDDWIARLEKLKERRDLLE